LELREGLPDIAQEKFPAEVGYISVFGRAPEMRNLILRKASESYLPGKRAPEGLELVLKRVHGKAPEGVRDHKRVGSLSELYQTPLDPI
jgi:hypothetical protein